MQRCSPWTPCGNIFRTGSPNDCRERGEYHLVPGSHRSTHTRAQNLVQTPILQGLAPVRIRAQAAPTVVTVQRSPRFLYDRRYYTYGVEGSRRPKNMSVIIHRSYHVNVPWW